MKPNFLPFFLLLFSIFSACKNDELLPSKVDISPQKIIELPNGLAEISGIIFKDEKSIYAHNDSGNEPYIYEVSLTEKKIIDSVKIYNVDNLDWEDIAQDEQYIYVAETGNNLGQRTDLKILKIEKSALQNQDSVAAEIINFTYEDQTDFTPTNQHNFDCEALISFGDELFLFSKNRKDSMTNCYSLPKTVGNLTAKLETTFEVNGQVTGATVNEQNNVIALLCYHKVGVDFQPSVWLFYDFSGSDFFSGNAQQLHFTFTGQVEAICFGKNHDLYFANENESANTAQHIYQIDVEEWVE